MRARHGDFVWLEHSGVLCVRRPLRRRSCGLIEFELAIQASPHESPTIHWSSRSRRSVFPYAYATAEQSLSVLSEDSHSDTVTDPQ
jgi:hypothetical protein